MLIVYTKSEFRLGNPLGFDGNLGFITLKPSFQRPNTPIAGVFIALVAIKYIANFSYTGKRSCPEIKRASRVSSSN